MIFNLINILWQFGTIVGSDGACISQCPDRKPQCITLFVVCRVLDQMKLEPDLVTISKCVDLLHRQMAVRIIHLVKIVDGGLSSSGKASPGSSDLASGVTGDKSHDQHFYERCGSQEKVLLFMGKLSLSSLLRD